MKRPQLLIVLAYKEKRVASKQIFRWAVILLCFINPSYCVL